MLGLHFMFFSCQRLSRTLHYNTGCFINCLAGALRNILYLQNTANSLIVPAKIFCFKAMLQAERFATYSTAMSW